MISVEAWLLIRNLKIKHPDMRTRRIAEFPGRARRAVRKALASEYYRSYSRPGCVSPFAERALLALPGKTGGTMVRRHILMNEIVEGIYQWHSGISRQTISRLQNPTGQIPLFPCPNIGSGRES